MTLSEQIVYGLIKPSRYGELIKLKKGRFATYTVVMMLALSIITFAIPIAAIITGFGGFEKLFSKNMASIEYSEGELSIEKPFEMSVGYLNIIIDTENAMVSKDELKRDGIYYTFGKEKFNLVYIVGKQVLSEQSLPVSQIFHEGFNNKSLIDSIPGIYAALVAAFFAVAVGYFLKYGFFALILALCVKSINRRLEINLSFGELFMICFYSQSLFMFINNINAALGFFPSAILSIIGFFVAINFVSTALITISKTKQV